MPDDGNPLLKRRRLAAVLREYRQRAGLNLDEVAENLYCSTTKISRLENAQRPANPRDVRDLCNLYGVPEDRREELMALAKASREPGWWEAYDLSDSYVRYIGHEAAASAIRDYKSQVVNGLLQTEEYAYALTAGYFSPVDPLVVGRLTDARMRRQQLFFAREPLPTMHFLLDEVALHRPIGGARTMADQLRRMIELGRTPEITIQIVPLAAGAHAGLETTFTILDFPDDSMPSVVNAYDIFGEVHLERPHEVEQSNQVFDRVAAMALDPPGSERLLAEVSEQYEAKAASIDEPSGDGADHVDEAGAGEGR
ncbi:helix-turn-helix domain-containing protein [Plantactinospora sp. GCM10030261]|uniref:helix-turn-helix domain-containing protein n=1 Tax=Plantactinospora sp. GCM10030261 TaxID=3273420 RepID=UPI0036178890